MRVDAPSRKLWDRMDSVAVAMSFINLPDRMDSVAVAMSFINLPDRMDSVAVLLMLPAMSAAVEKEHTRRRRKPYVEKHGFHIRVIWPD